jgi:hypothetical protein
MCIVVVKTHEYFVVFSFFFGCGCWVGVELMVH